MSGRYPEPRPSVRDRDQFGLGQQEVRDTCDLRNDKCQSTLLGPCTKETVTTRCAGTGNDEAATGSHRASADNPKGYLMLNSTSQATNVDDMFASFEMDELETLELTDSIALPEMGASWGSGWFCCSSSSSTCSAC